MSEILIPNVDGDSENSKIMEFNQNTNNTSVNAEVEDQNAPASKDEDAVVSKDRNPVRVQAILEKMIQESPQKEEKEKSLIILEEPETEYVAARDVGLISKPDEKEFQRSEDEKKIPKTEDVVESNEANADKLMIANLKLVLQKTSEERNSYQKKLEATEKKLASLQASYDAVMKGGGDENLLKRMVEQLKTKLIQTSLQLEDRSRTVVHQDKQIDALNSQVSSLKEVESLTRSVLQIRNAEIKHLQVVVDDMEGRIDGERERYNSMVTKMDAAVKLNADLKREYETQLSLFRDLRGKYEEKVTLLSEEKRVLESAQNASAENIV